MLAPSTTRGMFRQWPPRRLEESLIKMYLAGISVRRVEQIIEALWGTPVSPATVSNLNNKIQAKIGA